MNKLRRGLIFGCLSAAAVVAALVAPRYAGAAQGSWFAQGAGTVVNTADFPTPTTERWQWVATSNVGTAGSGAPAKGHFAESVPGTNISFDADVTCLNVPQ